MNLGAKIRTLRKEKNWTLKEMKNKTGLSISFLSDIERGVSNPSLKKLRIIANTFNVPTPYLLSDNTIKTNQNNAPVLYTIKDQQCTVSEKNKLEYHTIDLPAQKKAGQDYFFIKIKDDSMKESGIFPDSLVLIRKQSDVKDGDIAALNINKENTFLIRKVYRNKGTIILQAGNNNYETMIYPLEDIKVIGKVVSTRYYFEEI